MTVQGDYALLGHLFPLFREANVVLRRRSEAPSRHTVLTPNRSASSQSATGGAAVDKLEDLFIAVDLWQDDDKIHVRHFFYYYYFPLHL